MTAALADTVLKTALGCLDRAGAGCGCQGDLTDLLRDDAELYRGRGSMEVERLRGHILARLGAMGLGEKLYPYIVEELETGTSAAAVAGAARALRHAPLLAEASADRVLAAIDRLRNADDFVDLEACPARLGQGDTTCVGELILSLAGAGARGSEVLNILRARSVDGPYLSRNASELLDRTLIDGPSTPISPTDAALPNRPSRSTCSLAEIAGFEVQNEAGEISTLGRLCEGHTALIAFFYTRCLSPDKCSRTIRHLGNVAAMIRERRPDTSIFVGALSYDPEFDSPARLMRYGIDRGFRFGSQARLLRTIGDFAALRDRLTLSVGYGPSTVNRHRLELAVVDPTGAISLRNGNELWNEQSIVAELLAMESATVT